MGRLGTKDPGRGPRAGASGRLDPARAGRADDPLRDRRRARRRALRRQLERFTAFADRGARRPPRLLVHAANSAATLRDPRLHFDMVRCGIAVYGLDPFQQDPAAHGLEPALALTATWPRSSASSPATARATAAAGRPTEPTWVATLPIGYGDGWRRGLTNDCDVLIGGRRRPLVGTVSMDNVTVDLGPDTGVEAGDAGGADRRPGRRARSSARRWRGGSARSTTRSPAGSPPACRASSR